MKIACLLAPHLPVQVERYHVAHAIDPSLAESPLVVGGRPWDPGVVLDCCRQAEAAGVHPGMRLSQAEALCPAARFVPARQELYQAAHDALATAAGRFTPTVETAGLGLLYAQVSGLERSFGDDARLAHQMAQEAMQALSQIPLTSPPHSGGAVTAPPGSVQALRAYDPVPAGTCQLKAGISNPWLRPDVRVGIASGKFAAEQAARAACSGGGCAVPPGEERAFLSPLPLSALPADPEMLRRLHLLGVRSLGALAALPRPAVVHQFGPHAGPLYDLARGVDPRPVRPEAPPLQLARTCSFDDPLAGRAPLLAYAGRMAAGLAVELARRGYQAEGLRLQLEGENGEVHAAGTPVKPPSAEAEKLSRLAGRLMGGLAPSAPVAALTLAVYPLRPFHLGATQLALFDGDSAHDQRLERLREALRALRERFGEMIILVASLLGPPPPCPIHVTTTPQGSPCALVWHDRMQQVRHVYETWRERRYWWNRPLERDYFRLEMADGLVRVVFRDVRTDRWLLERRHF